MQLFSSDLSPFSARVRIQIRMKQLPIAIEAPPEPLRSDAFRQLFPLGKIPVLRTGQGDLAESWAIMEYLEERFPETPLRPSDAWARGQMQMRVRFMDLYFGPSFSAPFFYLFRKTGDAPSLQPLLEQADVLEHLLAGHDRKTVQLDDIALAPTFYFALAVTKALQQPDLLDSRPATHAWWHWVSKQAEVAAAIHEMDHAFQAILAR